MITGNDSPASATPAVDRLADAVAVGSTKGTSGGGAEEDEAAVELDGGSRVYSPPHADNQTWRRARVKQRVANSCNG